MPGELARSVCLQPGTALAEQGGHEAIIKDGPDLIGPPAAIAGVQAGGFDAACLANNHILDFGGPPLLDTIALARAHKLATFGAGADLSEAGELLVLQRRGLR